MHLSDREVAELKTAGWLHDIGKIAINEAILNKEGALTKEEWGEIKKHPEIGYRILSSVNEMAEMANNILAHHERYDGKGYPKGLWRDEIPLAARIICIADAYDAMTTERTYRPVRTKSEAIEELERNAGKQFDPVIVDVFVNAVLKALGDGF
jgi:HD-GYP domain-containing protein (c-di-GMP phosphodiesterase class II)